MLYIFITHYYTSVRAPSQRKMNLKKKRVYTSVFQPMVRGPPVILDFCPCGPSEKRRKNKIQINCVSHYSWKSQSLEMTHANRLSLFSQYWHFMKFITLLIYRPPPLLSATIAGFEALWTQCFSPSFPCTCGAAPVTKQGSPEFITEDQSTEPFHVFMTLLIVLPTPSLHTEIVVYFTSYTNNRTCQIA